MDAHTRLPDDWKPPQRVLYEREWDQHPRNGELVALARERDGDGNPKWTLREEDEPEDWTGVWFRAVDPLDSRPGIRICGWTNEWLERELANARMQAGESSED